LILQLHVKTDTDPGLIIIIIALEIANI